MSTATQRALMLALAKAGTWVGRQHLDTRLRATAETAAVAPEQLSDELNALVSAGAVQFNPRGGQYCLAGSALARRALQLLAGRPPEHVRELLMARSADGQHMRVAVAVRRQAQHGEPDLVMAEFQVPHHQGDPDKAQAIAALFVKLGGLLNAPAMPPAEPADARLAA